jgi:hypothetical protein
MPMNKISMTKKAFVKEHIKLVKVLRTGSKPALKREANDQAKELRKYKK